MSRIFDFVMCLLSVQVFPAFLERLPLRQDWQENPAVYGTLCSLMPAGPRDVGRLPDPGFENNGG